MVVPEHLNVMDSDKQAPMAEGYDGGLAKGHVTEDHVALFALVRSV